MSPSLRGFPLTLAPAQVDLPEIRYECDKKLILRQDKTVIRNLSYLPKSLLGFMLRVLQGDILLKIKKKNWCFEIKTLKKFIWLVKVWSETLFD